jgi:hypothetical protein
MLETPSLHNKKNLKIKKKKKKRERERALQAARNKQ